MTERIWLVSVPHTGTHFTMRLLERMGFDVRQTHCLTVGGGWVRMGRPVVVPVRNLVLARISELNRGHAEEPNWPHVTVDGFQTVMSWKGLPNVHHFHVNGDDQEVVKLAEFAGRPVPAPIDWSPVNRTEDEIGLSDPTGLKALYEAGIVNPELRPYADAWAELQGVGA